MDKHQLDMKRWFEQHNPTAQAQILERMLEAIRKGYWDAAEQTRREIAERWQELADRGLATGAKETREFAQEMAAGFGLQPGITTQSATASQSQAESSQAQTQTVRGQVMQETTAESVDEPLWRVWLALLAILLCFIGGGVHQLRHALPTRAPQH